MENMFPVLYVFIFTNKPAYFNPIRITRRVAVKREFPFVTLLNSPPPKGKAQKQPDHTDTDRLQWSSWDTKKIYRRNVMLKVKLLYTVIYYYTMNRTTTTESTPKIGRPRFHELISMINTTNFSPLHHVCMCIAPLHCQQTKEIIFMLPIVLIAPLVLLFLSLDGKSV